MRRPSPLRDGYSSDAGGVGESGCRAREGAGGTVARGMEGLGDRDSFPWLLSGGCFTGRAGLRPDRVRRRRRLDHAPGPGFFPMIALISLILREEYGSAGGTLGALSRYGAGYYRREKKCSSRNMCYCV